MQKNTNIFRSLGLDWVFNNKILNNACMHSLNLNPRKYSQIPRLWTLVHRGTIVIYHRLKHLSTQNLFFKQIA